MVIFHSYVMLVYRRIGSVVTLHQGFCINGFDPSVVGEISKSKKGSSTRKMYPFYKILTH